MALDQETFQLLQDSVQRFVRERLVPAENYLEEHDEVPADIVADMKELGLFGISIPEEYGGIGLSMAQECEVAYELGQTALAFRSVSGTNIGIGSQGILIDGTPEQKAEYLPRIASGELIISLALTEPDAGSDAASLKTKAAADGSDYLISGTKRFITNAPRAGAFTLMARTGGPGAGGISAFIVPAGPPACRASAWASPTRRWARRARAPATSISTACAFRPPTSSVACQGSESHRLPWRLNS